MFEIKITGASYEELRDQAAKLFGLSTCEKTGAYSPNVNVTPTVGVPISAVAPAAIPAPVAQVPISPPAPVQVATTPSSYTQDQLAYAAAALMEIGKQDALIALLGQFGVQALTELPPEQYGAFAMKLRELGATI